ncbi:MAG: exonuclease SbcCD subunit D [Chloroflexi bacterium]|nr:exonuclease SbcCD subunit D [Chloroflexota bacterium]
MVHTADLHLGIENYGRLDPATGLPTRVVDFLTTLDAVVDRAIGDGADLFLLCGDAYKTRDPNPTLQRELARRIDRLGRAGVAVFLLVGNHDLPQATGRASTLDIFQTLHVPNVAVGARPCVTVVQTRSGPIQVAALPWILRSTLLTRDEYKNRTMAEIDAALLGKIEQVVDGMTDELDPSLPAILAAHATLFGAELGSERNIMLGQDLILPPGLLARSRFAYVALGHIHRHQAIPAAVPTVYAGSLQRIDFGEEKEPKGYVVVDLEPAAEPTADQRFAARWTFQPVDARRFVTLRVAADTDDPTSAVLAAVEGRADELRDAVVRVQVVLSARREALLREGDVRRALKDAAFVAAIAREVDREHRPRLAGRPVEELTPLDALRLYLESKRTPPDAVETLVEFAQRLAAEREA